MFLKTRLDTPNSSFKLYTKVIPMEGFSRQLQSLYERRSALEALIASLEEYERLRSQKLASTSLKTA